MSSVKTESFNSFSTFYPWYLQEHQNSTCRYLHVIGTLIVSCILLTSLLTQTGRLLWLAPIAGYGFAWIGHFMFEKNKPATFTHPLYSLMGDFRMCFDVLIGKLK
jgi:hypothetical protein